MAIPCLGYPTRTAACVALKAQGLSHPEIAARVGVETKIVTALMANRRWVGQPRPERRPQSNPVAKLLDLFTVEERAELRAIAAKREMSAERLIITLVETALSDNLVGAILDDGRS